MTFEEWARENMSRPPEQDGSIGLSGLAYEQTYDLLRACWEDAQEAQESVYKWAYEYLQSRMESLGRYGWAHDCDGEIEHRLSKTTKID